MDFSSILRRAWRITWKHQALWLFGLMAMWTFPGIIANRLIGDAQGGFTGLLSAVSFGTILWASFLWALITGLVGAVVHAFGRTALVYQANEAEDGIEPSVRSGWEGGVRYFLRVLVITVLTNLPILVIFGAAWVAALSAGLYDYQTYAQPDAMPNALPDSRALNLICGCFGPSICLGLLLTLVLGTVQQLATRACVLQDEGIWQSIVTSWRFFRTNLGSVLMFWGIWLLIGIGILLLLAIPLCLLSVLVGGLAVMGGSEGMGLSDMISGSIWINLVWWVISTAFTSVWFSFSSTSWTLFYRDLSAPAEPDIASVQPDIAMPELDQGVL